MSEPKIGRPGPLQLLQFNATGHSDDALQEACVELSAYHVPAGNQASRHSALSGALETFLYAIVIHTPPGPERSTALSRAREAKFWASAGVALEAANGQPTTVVGDLD